MTSSKNWRTKSEDKSKSADKTKYMFLLAVYVFSQCVAGVLRAYRLTQGASGTL